MSELLAAGLVLLACGVLASGLILVAAVKLGGVRIGCGFSVEPPPRFDDFDDGDGDDDAESWKPTGWKPDYYYRSGN